MKKSTLSGHISALIAVLIWGGSFIASKILLTVFTPGEILFYRFLIGYITLLLFYPKPFLFAGFKIELLCLFAAFSGMVAYQFTENSALLFTSAANVGLLVTVAPFFTGIATSLTGGEKMRLPFVLGFCISIIGVFLVIYNGTVVLKLNPKGDFLALLAAAIWVFYTLATNKLNRMHLNILHITRRMFLYASVMSISFIWGKNVPQQVMFLLKPQYIISILFLGVLASCLGFVVWNLALKKLGALRSGVYIYLIPVVTMLCSSVLLNEHITKLSVLGTVFILAGLMLSEYKKETAKEKQGGE